MLSSLCLIPKLSGIVSFCPDQSPYQIAISHAELIAMYEIHIIDIYNQELCLFTKQDASGKAPTCQCRAHKRHGFNPWVKKTPCRRAQQPTPVSCQENPTDRGAWRATVHSVTESNTTKVTAQHSSK